MKRRTEKKQRAISRRWLRIAKKNQRGLHVRWMAAAVVAGWLEMFGSPQPGEEKEG